MHFLCVFPHQFLNRCFGCSVYKYDAWRNILKNDAKGIATGNSFEYTGYMYDKEIGMKIYFDLMDKAL